MDSGIMTLGELSELVQDVEAELDRSEADARELADEMDEYTLQCVKRMQMFILEEGLDDVVKPLVHTMRYTGKRLMLKVKTLVGGQPVNPSDTTSVMSGECYSLAQSIWLGALNRNYSKQIDGFWDACKRIDKWQQHAYARLLGLTRIEQIHDMMTDTAVLYVSYPEHDRLVKARADFTLGRLERPESSEFQDVIQPDDAVLAAMRAEAEETSSGTYLVHNLSKRVLGADALRYAFAELQSGYDNMNPFAQERHTTEGMNRLREMKQEPVPAGAETDAPCNMAYTPNKVKKEDVIRDTAMRIAMLWQLSGPKVLN
jgi:hypothetical protein